MENSTTTRPRRTWWPRLRGQTRDRARFVGLDAARGLAVIGMAIAHAALIPPFGTSPEALLGFVNGRASILFAMIAGVSIALITGGSRPLEGRELASARAHILGRAVMLLIVSGLAEMLGTAVAVILASYAMWFVIALVALRWRPRTLFLVAGGLALGGSALAYCLNWVLSAQNIYINYTPESIVPALLLTGVYPAVVWMAFVFAGMGIGRLGLDNVAALKRLLIAGAAMFVVGAAPFVVLAGSASPLFGGGTQPESEHQCLTEDRTGVVTCTQAEFDEQSAGYTEEDWAKLDELTQASGMRTQCLSEDGSSLVDCTEDELAAQFQTMTPDEMATYEKLNPEFFAAQYQCFNEDRTALVSCDEETFNQQMESMTEADWEQYDQLLMGMYGGDKGGAMPFDLLSAVWNFYPHSGSPFEVISSGGLAMAIISGFLLLARLRWGRWVLAPLMGVGAMALTAYVAHLVALYFVPEREDNWFALILIVNLILWCAVWQVLFNAGPLERLTGALADRVEGRPKPTKPAAAAAVQPAADWVLEAERAVEAQPGPAPSQPAPPPETPAQ